MDKDKNKNRMNVYVHNNKAKILKVGGAFLIGIVILAVASSMGGKSAGTGVGEENALLDAQSETQNTVVPQTFKLDKDEMPLAPWHSRYYNHNDYKKESRGARYSTSKTGVDLPFLFYNKQTKRKAIVCIPHDVDYLGLRFLFFKATGRNPTIVKYPGSLEGMQIQKGMQDIQKALQDPTVKRFMFVRNPYSRVLAGYQANVELVKNKVRIPEGYDPSTGFAGFTESVSYVVTGNPKINPNYFRAQTTVCNLDRKFKMDYYLKMEHIQYWYKPFIHYFGLQAEASNGWNFKSRFYMGSKKCFYHSAGKTCQNMLDSEESEVVNSDGASEEYYGKMLPAVGADTDLGDYFEPEQMEVFNHFVAADFHEFNYPTWSGDDAQAYIERIKEFQ